MSGEGAVRFYLPLNVQLPNDFFAQAVIVTKGLEQRDRVKAKLEKALASDFPNVIGRVYPLELGPPVGWPLQYRVSGPRARSGPGHRLQGRRDPRCRSRCLERQLQLDGAGPHGPHPRRPGRGAPAGPELAGSRPVAEHGRVRHHGHRAAQRHPSRRRGCARLGRAAHVDVRRCARCRCRCPTARPCRWARSPPSSTARNIPSSGGATAGPP